jgi:hypothetical protein
MVQILPTTLAFSLMYPVLVGYMSQFPPFAAELVPLFVAGFEALLFALGLHSLVGKRLHRGVLVALWLSVIVILAAKTPPYSEDFPIVGAESEFHFENGSSIASFTPVGGRRVIPGITEAPDIEFVQNYPGYLLPPGPAWLVRSKQTRPLTHRPTFSVVSTPGPFRQIHFDSGPLSDGIESVSLVVKCGDHECIERIEGFPEFRYRETSFGPFTAIVRFTPVLDRQTMDIWLTRFNISIDILYTSQAVSPERAKLRKSLGRHVCSFAKERFLADDVELFTNEV